MALLVVSRRPTRHLLDALRLSGYTVHIEHSVASARSFMNADALPDLIVVGPLESVEEAKLLISELSASVASRVVVATDNDEVRRHAEPLPIRVRDWH